MQFEVPVRRKGNIRPTWSWIGTYVEANDRKYYRRVCTKMIWRGQNRVNEFSVGDVVEVDGVPGGVPGVPYYVRVDALWEDERGERKFRGRYYYKPEQTKRGRTDEEGPELYETDEIYEADVSTILRTCNVLTWGDFQRLRVESGMQILDEDSGEDRIDLATYFCRSFYDLKTAEIRPMASWRHTSLADALCLGIEQLSQALSRLETHVRTDPNVSKDDIRTLISFVFDSEKIARDSSSSVDGDSDDDLDREGRETTFDESVRARASCLICHIMPLMSNMDVVDMLNRIDTHLSVAQSHITTILAGSRLSLSLPLQILCACETDRMDILLHRRDGRFCWCGVKDMLCGIACNVGDLIGKVCRWYVDCTTDQAMLCTLMNICARLYTLLRAHEIPIKPIPSATLGKVLDRVRQSLTTKLKNTMECTDIFAPGFWNEMEQARAQDPLRTQLATAFAYCTCEIASNLHGDTANADRLSTCGKPMWNAIIEYSQFFAHGAGFANYKHYEELRYLITEKHLPRTGARFQWAGIEIAVIHANDLSGNPIYDMDQERERVDASLILDISWCHTSYLHFLRHMQLTKLLDVCVCWLEIALPQWKWNADWKGAEGCMAELDTEFVLQSAWAINALAIDMDHLAGTTLCTERVMHVCTEHLTRWHGLLDVHIDARTVLPMSFFQQPAISSILQIAGVVIAIRDRLTDAGPTCQWTFDTFVRCILNKDGCTKLCAALAHYVDSQLCSTKCSYKPKTDRNTSYLPMSTMLQPFIQDDVDDIKTWVFIIRRFASLSFVSPDDFMKLECACEKAEDHLFDFDLLKRALARRCAAVDMPTLFEPPQSFLCPIGLVQMRDPVVASDGFTYDRANFALYALHGNEDLRSPMTREMLQMGMGAVMFPNRALKSQISEHRRQKMDQLLAMERVMGLSSGGTPASSETTNKRTREAMEQT